MQRLLKQAVVRFNLPQRAHQISARTGHTRRYLECAGARHAVGQLCERTEGALLSARVEQVLEHDA